MKCPACQGELSIPQYAERNVMSYGGSKKIVTYCCKKMIVVSQPTSAVVSAYTGNATEDDWGNKVE